MRVLSSDSGCACRQIYPVGRDTECNTEDCEKHESSLWHLTDAVGMEQCVV